MAKGLQQSVGHVDMPKPSTHMVHLQQSRNKEVKVLHTPHVVCGREEDGTAQRKIFHLAKWSQLIHPGPSSSRSSFFIESSHLYAATLTHYSTEQLTTGPDYDPLPLLLALAGDVHPNPGRQGTPARSKTSLAKVPATCVLQDVRFGYIQDVLVFETLRIIVKPMAGSVPPV